MDRRLCRSIESIIDVRRCRVHLGETVSAVTWAEQRGVAPAFAEAGEAQSVEARKLVDQSGCAYEFVISFGRPAEVIAKSAKDHGCDGIVIGTRGLGDVENVFLGSTSFKVVHVGMCR
jgi:nucleotide-binding universal stress UspA family protein